MKTLQIGRAFFLSPLVVPFIYTLGTIIHKELTSISQIIGALTLSAFISLPVSYISLLLFGYPIYDNLKKHKMLNIQWLTFYGSIAGMLVFTLFVWALGSFSIHLLEVPQVFDYMFIGGVLGGCTAFTFGIVAGISRTCEK